MFVSAKLRRPDHYIPEVKNLQWQVLVHVQVLQCEADPSARVLQSPSFA